MKDIYILSVETTCDETSLAIVKNGKQVVTDVILTQMETHSHYGGVVPEIASRMHADNITFVLEELMNKSTIPLERIDAVAVAYAPGLMGALLVGIEFAKVLSYVLNKPLIKVNHLIGHIYASKFKKDFSYPTLCLVVSGGHTELLSMIDDYEFKMLGKTLDDAIGETYDKVARVLGVPYPGGPGIENLALDGKDVYNFPVPNLKEEIDFSFSGLKSSVINLVNMKNMKNEELDKENIAASFQIAAIKQILSRVESVLEKGNHKNLIIAGGVSANNYLRSKIIELCSKYNVECIVPDFKYSTDNAAMIGAAAYPLYLKKEFTTLALNGVSHIDIAK